MLPPSLSVRKHITARSLIAAVTARNTIQGERGGEEEGGGGGAAAVPNTVACKDGVAICCVQRAVACKGLLRYSCVRRWRCDTVVACKGLKLKD